MPKIRIEDTLEFKRAKKLEEVYNKAIMCPLAEDPEFQSVILTLYYMHESLIAGAFESAREGRVYKWTEIAYAIYGSPFNFSRLADNYLRSHPEHSDILFEVFACSK